MESGSSASSGDESMSSWVEWFQTLRGNELFCTVDSDFLLDRFNLTGLNTEVSHFGLAYEIVTDALAHELDPDMWDEAEKSARHLYGMIHARFILQSKGLHKMNEKHKRSAFN
jgi:casein kinase II subunit beta